MGTLAFLCTNLWFLLILDPCLSRRWPCDRPLESNVKMFWRWETIGKTHWENHWEKLKLNVIFWDLFFFWGGAVFEQCIQRGCGGPELETSHDRPGSKPVPGAPQTLSDAIEEENFEFDVPWDSQNRWTYKGKNIGCEEKCGKFFGLKLEVGRFLDFQNFYFGCFKIVFQFFIALIRSQSGHVFCCYHFRSSGATPEVVFFFSKVGEVNARLDECSPLDVRICPPQHGDMYGNNSKSLEKAKKKIKVLTSLKNWHFVFGWPESQHQKGLFFWLLKTWCLKMVSSCAANDLWFETRNIPQEKLKRCYFWQLESFLISEKHINMNVYSQIFF